MKIGYRQRLAILGGALVVLGIVWTDHSGARIRASDSPKRETQTSVFRRVLDYQVTFRLTQGNTEMSPATEDQITIVFANRPADGPRPPRPLFGDDILQEFSFSGMDVVNGAVTFTRRVRDKSFVDATYIRVVNHGNDGWAGDRISITVDGEEVLSNVPMRPRRGADVSKGFQKFNARNWAQRTFWEAELRPLRARGPRAS